MDKNKIILNKQICIDLGGIAKGYAVDEAIKILQEHGISSGIVNAGGDLRCFGDQTIPLDVRHPIYSSNTCHLGDLLHNNAAATSAGYYSRKDNRMPIVNPTLQNCIHTYDSVTVIASKCIIADALTKIVLMDSKNSHNILKYFDARAFLLRHDDTTGDMHVFDSHSAQE
jgi:thiamine biosynthesis lipoprotein